VNLPEPFEAAGPHITIGLPGGRVLFTTRHGGVSEGPYESLNLGLWTDDDPTRVEENRQRVANLAGVPRERLAQGRQVHGAHVRRVGTAPPVAGDPPGPAEADGQATALPGIAPIVLVADCLPVALVAPQAIAMLHAGWRGLAAGVLEEGLAAVRALGARDGVVAAIGPGIGPCCYEVGPEVHEALGTSGPTADLKAVAAERLRGAGVGEVHDVGLCTACDPEQFFSHRRDAGVTGRQAGLAWRS
jgi:YfiH family protein